MPPDRVGLPDGEGDVFSQNNKHKIIITYLVM